MMTTENSDLYEVTCLDCNTTKSYFTAQGASYFKLSHQGHKIKVKEPGATEQPKREEPAAPPRIIETVEEPVAEPEEAQLEGTMEAPVKIRIEEPLREPEPEEPVEIQYEAPAGQVLAEDRVRLGNLVVDVVDEGSGRAVKIFGIANGRERFTKSFNIAKINELNGFLESGVFYDDASKVTYTWTPDKVDLSVDVATMIDSPQAAPEAVPEPEAVKPKVEEVRTPEPIVPGAKARPQAAPAIRAPAPTSVPAPAPASSIPEDVLLGKRSYIQEGEDYAKECARVSKVLRKFRWNTEPPYVIGAVFDDLVCVQSQNGTIKSELVDEVKRLGYAFVAIEAPGGIVSAWFKKNEADEATEIHA